jgi:hypothetical protein
MSPNRILREAEDADAASPSMIITASDERAILPVADWRDTDILVTLDSGCCEHIMDVGDAPGYEAHVKESAGSRRGQSFTVGNGAEVPNEGQLRVNLEATCEGRGPVPLSSDFQIAEITRPLMSVSRICEQGYTCLFTKDGAQVLDKDQRKVCEFQKRSGLYVSSMKLKPPEPFQRQAA